MNYIEMSYKSYLRYQIYTNFIPESHFDLDKLGIYSNDTIERIMLKVNDDIEDEQIIIHHNSNSHTLCLTDFLECNISKK